MTGRGHSAQPKIPDKNYPPPRTITVYKLDENGQEVWRYEARVVARDESSIRLEAYFDRSRVDIGPVTFKKGDRFVETFYSERWYNVFAVYRRETGRFKGWYCNICRPAEINEHDVKCEDLALDVWVDEEGDVTILDEDEFATLRISVAERQRAMEALQRILQLAAENRLPA